MGVDVVHVASTCLRVSHGDPHCARDLQSLRVEPRHVMRIRRASVTGEFVPWRAGASSSRTRTPAPSPITKPSLFLSKGRLASSGSAFRKLNAFMAAKPATASGVIVASHPPARKTSASPHLIARQASPTELLAVAHAVTKQILGPRKLSASETRALAAFPIMQMIAKGEIREGPCSMRRRASLSVLSRPPIPVPMNTPKRSRLT